MMALKVDFDEGQSNTIDPEQLKKDLMKIEDAIAAKESHRMGYVESCKPYNERIANAYEMASKSVGVSIKILKAKVRERELQRKIENIAEDFDDDARDSFEMVSQALGEYADTPLGRAAVDKAAGKEAQPLDATPKKPRGRPRKADIADPAKADDEADLRPPHLQRADADREQALQDEKAAEENAKRLNAGIQPLH